MAGYNSIDSTVGVPFLSTNTMQEKGGAIKDLLRSAFDGNISACDQNLKDHVCEHLIDMRGGLSYLPNQNVQFSRYEQTDISNILVDPALYIEQIISSCYTYFDNEDMQVMYANLAISDSEYVGE